LVSAVTSEVTGDECCGVGDEYNDDEDDNGGNAVAMSVVVAMISMVWWR
jgi:hypothetical protein